MRNTCQNLRTRARERVQSLARRLPTVRTSLNSRERLRRAPGVGVDPVAGKGRRSNLIDRAVRRYVKAETRANLRKQLAASYQANAEDDLRLAEDWFPLDEQAAALGRR